MPTYEYACEKCGHEFEREQRITDAPVKTCPACRSRKVRKLISRTAFVLKGSGWYSDLYSSPKPGPKQDSAAGDKEGAASAGKEATSEGAAPAGDSKPGSEGKSGSESKPTSKSKGKSKKPKAAA